MKNFGQKCKAKTNCCLYDIYQNVGEVGAIIALIYSLLGLSCLAAKWCTARRWRWNVRPTLRLNVWIHSRNFCHNLVQLVTGWIRLFERLLLSSVVHSVRSVPETMCITLVQCVHAPHTGHSGIRRQFVFRNICEQPGCSDQAQSLDFYVQERSERSLVNYFLGEQFSMAQSSRL